MFRAALVTPAQNWKQSEWFLTSEWTNCCISGSWFKTHIRRYELLLDAT